MEPVTRHLLSPDVSFDGGDLNCGNGLLLMIRQHIDPLDRGRVLEVRSTDSSVDVDLPAWCRMTRNELVSWTRGPGGVRSFLVCKGALSDRASGAGISTGAPGGGPGSAGPAQPIKAVTRLAVLPGPAPAPAIAPLSVMGIGSWPRPRWMRDAIRAHIEGRLGEADFQATADDAVRLCVDAQLRAGADVITDGEQRRDNYASFVGGILDNCQLIPLTDLLPLVADPEEFEAELRALDIPAGEVRHPAVFGPIGRSRPIAVHELEFARSLTTRPIKVALPGPYLLTRTMWMECISDRAYASREALAADIVAVMREELADLLAHGAALVQFDEPVLTEVVFSGSTGGGSTGRSFMCGALSEKKDSATELGFACDLMNAVVDGMPGERIAVHMCRGNWTCDESVALAGDYRPLLGYLRGVRVGTLMLELCTPRAGELEVLAQVDDKRVGIGVVNQKHEAIESRDEILAKMKKAVALFGRERVLFSPDCGFATFADNPIASARIAEAKLTAIVEAARALRDGKA